MYVITVIPIQRGIGKETLTYFTSSKVELGSLVKVPLRKQTIDALVILIEDARNKKADIKSSTFTLRKIDKLVSKPFLPEAFMQTVNEVSRFHACTTGAVLNVLLPKKVLGALRTNILSRVRTGLAARNISSERATDTFSITGGIKNRIDQYKKEIEKEPLTVIVVPTKEYQLTFKKQFKDCQVILPSSLIEIPLTTKLIIIEDEGSNAYKGISRPFLDFRMAIKTYAQYIGAKIITGNTSLNPNIEKILEEHSKGDFKTLSAVGTTMKKGLFSLKDGGHLFILGTRTGHSGTVLCQDCSSAVMCPRCNSPYTLHMKKTDEEYNNLLCHHCGHKETALVKCKECGSWRLKAFGLGIEKIEEDAKAFCKKQKIDASILRIDSTLKLTPKKIREVIAKHYDDPASVLIGTELVLPYLVAATLEGYKNDGSFLASLDTLLALPDYSINEKIWRMATFLDDITTKKTIIQARDINHPVLKFWSKNDEKGFFDSEKVDRKAFNYPPYGVFIKISVKGRKDRVGQEMRSIEAQLKKWKPMIFPAFIKTINNQHIMHALITLPKDKWVDEDLLEILLDLPMSATIDVNPRSLL